MSLTDHFPDVCRTRMEQFLLAMQPWVLMEAPHLSNRIGIGLIYSFFVVGDEAGDTFFFWKKELAQNCDFKFFFSNLKLGYFFEKWLLFQNGWKFPNLYTRNGSTFSKILNFWVANLQIARLLKRGFLLFFRELSFFLGLKKLKIPGGIFFFPGLRTAEEFPLVFHIFSGNLQVASEDVDFKLRCCFRLWPFRNLPEIWGSFRRWRVSFFFVYIFPWWSFSAELRSLPAGSDDEEARCGVNFRGVYLVFLLRNRVFFCTYWN